MYNDQPKKIFTQGIYEISSTPKERIGDLRFFSDGRVFMYAKAGYATVAGDCLQAAVPVAVHMACAVAIAAAADDMRINATIPTTGFTLNQYKDGYAHINNVAGEGYVYRISHHPVIALDTAGYINLFDPIQVALTTSSKVTFTKHPADSVIQMVATNPTAMVCGVAPVVCASGSYFWMQVSGAAAVLIAGVAVIGDDLVPSATAGAAMPSAASNATLHSRIGHVLTANATTDMALVWLTIL